MNKLSLKMKLGVGFGTLLVILVAMGVIAYRSVDRLATLSEGLEDKSRKVVLAKDINLAVMKESSGTRGFLLLNKENTLERYEQGKREYKESRDELKRIVVSEAGKKALAEVERTYEAFLILAEQEISFHREGKTKEALEIISGPAAAANEELKKAIEEYIAHEEDSKKKGIEEQNSTESEARTTVLSLAVIGLLVGFGVAVMIVRSITRSIARHAFTNPGNCR